MRDSHGVPICRVIRYIPCKVNNRFESLVAYQLYAVVRSSTGIASNHYGTVMRFGCGKMILLITMLMKLLMMIQVLMLFMIKIDLLVNLFSLQLIKHS